MRDDWLVPPERRSPLRRVFSSRDVRWFELDWHVLALAGVLLALGVAFVRAMSQADLGLDRHQAISLGSHLRKVCVTLPLVALGIVVRPRWLRRNSYLLYGATVLLLALVPWIGDERNNARRWIQLPMFDLQPSELAKLGVVLALGRALYRNRLDRPRAWALPVALVAAPMGMVALQPDLGTALTLVPVSLGMFYLAGARAGRLLAIVGGVALAGLAVVQLELGVREYQLQRVETWMRSFDALELIEARNGPAFHTYHARVAIGNGGVFGRGLGRGIANEAGYLPERDADSIFAVVAEEGGFIGGACVVVLYGLLCALILARAGTIRDRFARLVVGGVALYFAAHFFINVGVNLGLLPMTGLTLPLLSTGGSSLLASFLALGLAVGLSAHREPSLDRDAFRS